MRTGGPAGGAGVRLSPEPDLRSNLVSSQRADKVRDAAGISLRFGRLSLTSYLCVSFEELTIRQRIEINGELPTRHTSSSDDL